MDKRVYPYRITKSAVSRTKINWGSGNGKGSVILCMGNDDRQHQTQEYVGGVGEFEKIYCIFARYQYQRKK